MANYSKKSILLTAIIDGEDHEYYEIEQPLAVKIANAVFNIIKEDVDKKDEKINLDNITWEY